LQLLAVADLQHMQRFSPARTCVEEEAKRIAQAAIAEDETLMRGVRTERQEERRERPADATDDRRAAFRINHGRGIVGSRSTASAQAAMPTDRAMERWYDPAIA